MNMTTATSCTDLTKQEIGQTEDGELIDCYYAFGVDNLPIDEFDALVEEHTSI